MQRGCVFSRQNLSSPAVVQVTETNNAARLCFPAKTWALMLCKLQRQIMQRGCVFSRQNLSCPAAVRVTETNNPARLCVFPPIIWALLLLYRLQRQKCSEIVYFPAKIWSYFPAKLWSYFPAKIWSFFPPKYEVMFPPKIYPLCRYCAGYRKLTGLAAWLAFHSASGGHGVQLSSGS